MAKVKVPTVGRQVHYRAYGTPGGEFPAGVDRAATVTEVELGPDGKPTLYVGLMVANPTGLFFNRHIAYSETMPGMWHWPEIKKDVEIDVIDIPPA